MNRRTGPSGRHRDRAGEGARAWAWRAWAAFILGGSLVSTPVQALDPTQALPQYKHNRWTEENGAPTPITGIAEGLDGFLWMSGQASLHRFDGVRFEAIPVEASNDDHGTASVVMVARNGDVWTFFPRSRRFAVYRHGALRLAPSPEVKGRVTRMIQGRDGAIWAGVGEIGGGLLRYADGAWSRYGPGEGLPRDQLMGLLAARDGAIWVSYLDSVLRLAPGGRRFELVMRDPDSVGTLTEDPAGRVWLSDRRGSRALTGPGGRGRSAATGAFYPTDNSPRRGRTTFDRDGNLWIARRNGGIERLSLPAPQGAGSPAEAVAHLQTFGADDGLTSNSTYRVLEDREGDIWVATSRGLDKFRQTNIVVEPALTRPAAYGDVLFAGSNGMVFVAEADAVYRIAPGGAPKAILRGTSEPEAMCQAPDGTLWIAFADQVLTWKDGVTRRLPHPPAETGLYACGFDRHGDVWFTAAGSGLYRYRAKRWEPMFGSASDDGFHPLAMTIDAKQRLIVHWDRDTLAWLDFPGLERTRIDYGGEKPNLAALSAGPHLLAAGSFGVARIAPGRFEALSTRQAPGLRGVIGLVQTSAGDIWGATQTDVVHVIGRDLDRAFADRAFTPPTVRLGFDDGLPGRVPGDGLSTIARGGDGRIWVATDAGTVWIDPARIRRNRLAPPVVVTGLRVDGTLHRDPVALTLPKRAASVEIDYTALSLAIPERVRFRYRLEGFETDWVDAGTRRQAFYTNLPPGRYRFRVIAANNDGVWNTKGAVVAFEIPPAFVQTPWFLALCLGLAASVLWLLYRVRMAQMARRVRERLEERLGERERIARELHDTLLQSVQGLILRFQSVTDRLPPEAPVRGQLEATLKRADDVMIEGRNRVRDLRLSEGSSDLRAMIEALVANTSFEPPIAVRVVLEGRPQPLEPLVAAEIGRIVGEALLNIARHARAGAAEIEICFDAHQLVLTIRDNGVGLDPEVIRIGHKDGHFGLVGMRERAERIGGTLTIESAIGKGTDLTLTTPARLAYAGSVVSRWRRRFRLAMQT